MTQNYIAGKDIYFEYGDSKNDKIDKAYVTNRDMTVQVELDDSHDAYPVSRVIKQEPNGNVVVQEVVDDEKFHSFHRSQGYNGEGVIGDEEDLEEGYNDDEYDYLHSICAYCQNDHRCDHDMQMEEEDEDEYEYDDEEDDYNDDEDEDEEEEEEEVDDDEYNDHDCQCPHHHLHYSHHHHHHHSQHYTKHEHNQCDSHHMSHRHCKDASDFPRSSLLEKQKRIIKEQIQRPASGNFLWDFEFPEDIPDMIEFWIGLPYEKKREIASIDFLKELEQIHNHQKPQGSCRLCGNRKSLIEKELEKLYNGYYNVRKLATESLDECDLNIETINAIFFIVEEEKIVEQEESTDSLERELLSMADDLVKNNGENFINLIEQLDSGAKDKRISNASPVSDENDEHGGKKVNQSGKDLLQKGENNLYHDEYEHNNENVDENIRKEEGDELEEDANNDEKDEEEEGEEEEEVEEEDDEDYGFESDNASCSSDVSENDYTSRKRLEETYKMLQIFSSKVLRKKVHDAFQAKRAEDISRSLLAEEERESKLKKEKEEKEKKKKEKAKEKKRLQRLAKEEERKRLEKEKEESERLIREEQLRKTEEGRKRKEAEKKKREEELKAKQEEKKRRRELEQERSRKEKEEKERKKQEAKKQRDEELMKKREEKEKKERERQEKKEQEKQLLLQKQKEEQESLVKHLSELKLIKQKNKEVDMKEEQKQAENSLQESRPHMDMPTTLPNNAESLGSHGLLPQLFNSNFMPMNQSTLATPPHHFTGFDSTPLLESPSLLNMRPNASSLYGPNTFSDPFGNDSGRSNPNPLINSSGLTTNVANTLLNDELGFQDQSKGLFSSALFDSKSLSGEGTPKVNEGSIWNSSVTPLNNLGTRKSSEPAAAAAAAPGRHNSIWSSGEMSDTRTPSFTWSTPGANGTDQLNGNTHTPGVGVSAMENLGMPQIELIQLESFNAASRLPHISSDTFSVPLLYHYTRTLLAGKLPSLKLEQYVAALSYDLGSKLQFSFRLFKDDKNEDVVKIMKLSGMLPANGMGGMNLNSFGMDMNYMNSSQLGQLGGLNGNLKMFNGMNNINPLNRGGLENLAMDGNGLNLTNNDVSLLNSLNGMGSINPMSMNALNMNLADLNMNMNMNMNMNLNMNANMNMPNMGLNMGLDGMSVNMTGLNNPLQDYNNSVGLDAKDSNQRQPSVAATSAADGRLSSNSGSALASSTVAADTWPLF
ncbi:hypothetical protein PMKS-003220 [Pichia membranifaciens]|uniref:Stress response protein NST1 n=1 Tax=Pichia membranifaciens TaxID=4926 RepID=A0A1Q2YJI5_9ASCO|nr:hypothetical protein PMKS-003220 [Pichia membranifaciens]